MIAFILLIMYDIVYIKSVILYERRNAMAKNLRLKAARAQLDMSQQALADAVDVTRQTISAIERCDYNPSIKLCIRICEALNVTLNDLFWEEHKHDTL